MTGIYFIRLEPEVRFAAVGAVQFFMTVCNSVNIKSCLTAELIPYINELTGRKPIILPIILDIKKETKVETETV